MLRNVTWTRWDIAVVGIGVAVIAALQVSGLSAVSKQTYVVEQKSEIYGPAPRLEHKKASEAFVLFLEMRGYYGAFASASNGAYHWAANHTSQANADRTALQNCAEFSEDCQIVARLRPAYDTQFKGFTLSYSQASALDAFVERPNHKAIALADSGVWGAAWGRVAPFVAKQAALRSCQLNFDKQGAIGQTPDACRLVTLD